MKKETTTARPAPVGSKPAPASPAVQESNGDIPAHEAAGFNDPELYERAMRGELEGVSSHPLETPENIEALAKRLCRRRGIDPEGFFMGVPKWKQFSDLAGDLLASHDYVEELLSAD